MKTISLRFPILLIASLIIMFSIWTTQVCRYDDYGDYDREDCFITCVENTGLPY